MDNLQTGIFDRVYYDLGLNAAEALGELGNCEAKKLHRGPVYLLMTGEVGRRDATLTVARYPAQPDDVWSTSSRNGNALDVIGALNMQGPLIGGFFWGQANADWVNAGNQNAWESFVEVTVVQDAEGTACPVARSVTVYLPRNATSDPNVRQGDILQFMICRTGKAYCTSDVLDGKIGEFRELGLSEDPNDYPQRGWYIADGVETNGTLTTDFYAGAQVGYGYTGAGDYTTVGASISASFTFTGGDPVNLTIANATSGITVSDHADHIHQVLFSAATVEAVLNDHSVVGNDGTASAGSADVDYATSDFSHSLSDDLSAFSTGAHDAGTFGATTLAHTVNEPNSGAGHNHTGTVSTSDIAGELSFSGTPRAAGIVILRVQRLD